METSKTGGYKKSVCKILKSVCKVLLFLSQSAKSLMLVIRPSLSNLGVTLLINFSRINIISSLISKSTARKPKIIANKINPTKKIYRLSLKDKIIKNKKTTIASMTKRALNVEAISLFI